MGAPSPRVPAPRRVASLLLLACLLALAAVPSAATASTRHRTFTAARVDRPGPGDDFPQLPVRCQSVYKQLPFKPCHITSYGPSHPLVVVWGDSHAWMYQPALARAARQRHINLVLLIAGGCPPAIARAQVEGQGYTECEARDTAAFSWIQGLQERGKDFKLVLGAFWSGYRDAYRRLHDGGANTRFTAYDRRLIDLAHAGTEPLFRRLGRLGVRTDVIGQAATVPPHPGLCVAGREPYQCDLPRTTALNHEQSNRAWLERMMSYLSGTPRRIDATPAYCTDVTCYAHVGDVTTWYDDIHLGKHLTRTLAPYFAASFDDMLRS